MDAWFFGDIPRWGVMWGVALAVYALMKALTWASRRAAVAPAWKHFAYLLAWPGMDADTFLYVGCATRPAVGEWLFAAGKTSLGLLLIIFAAPASARFGAMAEGWVGMLGIVFTLHFGLFHLLACLWRTLGVEARPLMNWPIAAVSLADFWGRRWNLAFRDLTNAFVFRPLVGSLGPSRALLAGFVASGLIHDLVISIPAGGGYGLPTLYFTFQGAAMLGQHRQSAAARRTHHPMKRRVATALLLLAPSPLLLHGWFVHRVVVPFLQAVSVTR